MDERGESGIYWDMGFYGGRLCCGEKRGRERGELCEACFEKANHLLEYGFHAAFNVRFQFRSEVREKGVEITFEANLKIF